jgi:hypothetical protein
MAPARSVLSMAQPVPYLLFPVWIGSTKTASRIIRFTVSMLFSGLIQYCKSTVLAWTTDPLKRVMLAFTPESYSQLRMPAGDDNTSSLNLIAYVRDMLDCVAEFNMSSLTVVPDSAGIASFVDAVQNPGSEITNNPLVRLLFSGNQNTVGQVITSLSQEFNKMNSQSVANAVSSND